MWRRGLPAQHCSAAAVRAGKAKCDAVWSATEIGEGKKKKKDSANSLMAAGRFLQKSGKFMTLLIIACKSSCLTKL